MVDLYNMVWTVVPDQQFLVKAAFLGVVLYAFHNWWEAKQRPKSHFPPHGAASSSVTELDSFAAESTGVPPPQDPEAQKAAVESILAKATQYQDVMGDGALTTEHLVLALAQDPRFGEILSCMEGLSERDVKEAIRRSRLIYNHGDADFPTDNGPIGKYCVDLTQKAKDRSLDPVVGRHDEIRRCINILSRRTKNNPVLLGEPGVGKTAVVEGLAQRIAGGDVPASLQGVSVMSLDMGSIIAGATYPGEFEERLKGLLQDLTADPTKFILFIDDLHTVTGPNAQQGGGVNDASLLLKPLLSRGELRCVGCTSLDKYRKFIEKDPALDRRFQQVTIDEPTVQQTVSILRGLRRTYEGHHEIRITDAALVAAATLSARYVTDRFLPDKAIDLVDEATAKVKMEAALKPEALDRLDRRIKQLHRERRVLLRTARRDRNDAAQLEALDAELQDLQAQLDQAREGLGNSAERNDNSAYAETPEIKRIQDELDKLSKKIDAASRGGNPERESELKSRRRALLKDKLRLTRQAAAATGRHTVTEADIARVISRWTGIPLTKLVAEEKERLLQLGSQLSQRVIGQSAAVSAVAAAIQRSRAGMKDPNGPIASFLFLGPTGVGKTELAKALAATLFDSEEAMVRLDMSEYMEKHAVSKLIGAPPGYVGFDEGGQLTEAVRRRPYTVVLFDEVEKAHVDVFNLLLQILDDGRVTDSQGRTVSFKNSLIIMTSNLGSAELMAAASSAGAPSKDQRKKQPKKRPLKFDPLKSNGAAAAPLVFEEDEKEEEEEAEVDDTPTQVPANEQAAIREKVMEHVRRHFPPEFINRIDEYIIFDRLMPEQIRDIVELRLRGVHKRLGDKRVQLQLDQAALDILVTQGYDPTYGARPVKRALQRQLETPLAHALLRGDFGEDDVVVATAAPDGKSLTFTKTTHVVPAAVPSTSKSNSTTNGAVTQSPSKASTTASAAADGGEEDVEMLVSSDDSELEEEIQKMDKAATIRLKEAAKEASKNPGVNDNGLLQAVGSPKGIGGGMPAMAGASRGGSAAPKGGMGGGFGVGPAGMGGGLGGGKGGHEPPRGRGKR